MKRTVFLLIIVVIIPLFSVKISAQEQIDGFLSDFEDILPEGISKDILDTDRLIETASLRGLLSEILSAAQGSGSAAFGFFLTLVGITLLLSLSSLCHERLAKQTEAGVSMVCSVVIFGSVRPLFDTVTKSLTEVSNFFSALIPISVGMTALGGAEATAGVQASGMYLTLSIVSSLGGRALVSVSTLGLAMALLSSLGSDAAASLGRGVKSLFYWAVGIITALISGAFSLQTAIASSADSAAMRAAKYLASGLIPVVGSTVSGALATLVSGISYAKTVVGGGSIVVLLLLALAPLVMLLLFRLALSVAIALAGLTGAGGAERLFSAYRLSLDMAPSVYALSWLVYLFEIILFLRMGVAFL